jgi:hypothetical protein
MGHGARSQESESRIQAKAIKTYFFSTAEYLLLATDYSLLYSLIISSSSQVRRNVR